MTTPSQQQTDLISPSTRRHLQEYFVGTSLRVIEAAFEDAGVKRDEDFPATDGSVRRNLVRQYYATMNFADIGDVRKFLRIYAEALDDLAKSRVAFNADDIDRTTSRMIESIQRDGFELKNGKLVPIGGVAAATSLKEVASKIDAPYLHQQIERIEEQADIDPRLAIGTSKELVETVCKAILADRGIATDRKWELMDLVKRTREELKLVPDAVPDSAKAADTIRKLLSNLATITQSLAELRNSYGIGMVPTDVPPGYRLGTRDSPPAPPAS
ncbi:MAG TPA: abortive infection family protein [Pirellulaceae bacterium]|jgi:hypothetical protein|nr:abortive infection family protein [Pirellulaceae bacterium]